MTQPACTWAGPPCCPTWGDNPTNNAVLLPNSCCLHQKCPWHDQIITQKLFHTTGGGLCTNTEKKSHPTDQKQSCRGLGQHNRNPPGHEMPALSTWAKKQQTLLVHTRVYTDAFVMHTLAASTMYYLSNAAFLKACLCTGGW